MTPRWIWLGLILAAWSATPSVPSSAAAELPNVVFIYIDDMGYADIGPFGAQGYATPNLDRMAREGRIFTDFYVAQAVCSASRAALLTGCYPNRIGIEGAMEPWYDFGIHERELTFPQMMNQKGYATGMVGKWHLGTPTQFLPNGPTRRSDSPRRPPRGYHFRAGDAGCRCARGCRPASFPP